MSRRRLGLFKKPSGGFDVGNALRFDGASYTHNVAVTGFTNGKIFTKSIWIKEPTGDAGYIMSHDTTSSIYINFSKTSLYFRTGTGSALVFTIPARNSAIYNNIVITSNLGLVRVYVNAVESTTGAKQQGGTLYGFYNMQFGSNSTESIIGTYDITYHTMWFDHIATQQEITDLYGGGVIGNPLNIIAEPTYNFNFNGSGTDTTIVDLSPNGNNYNLDVFPPSGMWIPTT